MTSTTNYQLHWREQLISPRKRVALHGLRPSLSPTTVLLYINQHFMMQWHCIMAGHHGNGMSVEHALSCAKGSFPIVRHNEIRDLTANLLTEVCKDVCVEPELQPVQPQQLSGAAANAQDGARVDISANGVWGGRFEKTYFDVRVFNPHAPSNKNMSPTACYRKHEREKKRTYEQRIQEVEHSTFTPLVLSTTGGLGKEAASFYKRLASLLSTKWDTPYSTTFRWLRCRLSFSLLRSSIQAIRGARSSCGHAVKAPSSVDLATTESRMSDLLWTDLILFLSFTLCMPCYNYLHISLVYIFVIYFFL